MAVKIHHSVIGQGSDVLLLHGLFGMGSNLGSLARALQDEYRVHTIDLPNHGRSQWLLEAGITALANAIAQWMDECGVSSAALVGHSLGGKVAMQLALSQPARVNALVVADIAPVDYPSRHNEVFAALLAVAGAGCRSRAEAGKLMASYLQDEGTIQFLLMSLRKDENGTYNWRFNLAGLEDNYAAVREAPAANGCYDQRVLFVKGADSDYILPEHEQPIRALFPQSQVRVMADCGHWLHAQQPRLFNSIVKGFLAE
ncbi:MAG: esterase [Halieaceae bacterium]|jgi:esterase